VPATFTRSDEYDHVGTLRIDNGALNLLDTETIADVSDAIARLPENVAVLVIRGADRGDSGGLTAGIPLDEVKDYSTTEARGMLRGLHGMIESVRNVDAVTVCGCGEYAIGAGLELAISCDFRVTTEDSKLGLPEIDVGLVTGIQGGLLVRLVGVQAAKELIYTGELVSGAEARQIGLVNRAVAVDEYENAIDDIVGTLAGKSPLVLRMQKQVFGRLRSNGVESGVDGSLETIAACFDTDDQTEAMEAFLESREPTFEGR